MIPSSPSNSLKLRNQFILASNTPELKLLYAIPNGGHMHKAIAVKLKAEGAKLGIPSIILPVPRGNYHGLYIEMKVAKNKPSEHQRNWISQSRAHGYRVEICYRFGAAKTVIEDYLKHK